MHDYLIGIEAVRFAFIFGVVTSMFLYERRHITTGSIVVPGYIAVFVLHPLVLIATFLNALISYWLINHVAQRFFLLYGRTKFSLLVVSSMALQWVLLKLSPSGPYLWESDVPLFVAAGYVIPALIAHDMGRQGVRETTKAALAAGLIVAGPLLAALLFVPGARASRPLVDFAAIAFDPTWVPLAVFAGAIASWGLLHNHKIRSGGFIGVTYLAMLSTAWWQIVYLMVAAVVTWFIVTHVLSRFVILFGRRKFSSMLLVGALLSWVGLALAVNIFGLEDKAFATLASIALGPLFLPGLLANDMHRASPGKVLLGAGLGGTFIFSGVTFLYASVNGGSTTSTFVLGCVALLSGAIIFDRQLSYPLLRMLTGTELNVHEPPDQGAADAAEPIEAKDAEQPALRVA
ncbi:MAG TPA: poly-gamma-glutamate biosynthesis protein PgsC/CapC [Acidimicrobiia bacterium]|jgi:poly-gamma-glutamate biosynthesis protein PgsC/CapC|nr:poly-gamma-glutamate biosynthesis protein PgsC/CapC [Acidimicrobiia bacterium]